MPDPLPPDAEIVFAPARDLGSKLVCRCSPTARWGRFGYARETAE